jgi:hypothetical protein
MKRIAAVLAILALAFAPQYAMAAPTLSWDTVTTGVDGLPLANGMEVKSYEVYRCPVNAAPCTIANSTKIGSVPAASPVVPRQSFDLVGQPFPTNLMVTAVNIIGESLPSDTAKAVPGDRPKNVRIP